MGGSTNAGTEVAIPGLILEHARMLNNVKPYIHGFSGYGGDDDVPSWGTSIAAGEYYNQGVNVRDETNTAALVNPYTGLSAYDPHPLLDGVDALFEEFSDVVFAIEPEGMLETATGQGISLYDEHLSGTAPVNGAISSFEARTEEAFQRRVSLELAALLGGRAVMTGGFDDAMACLSNQRESEMADFAGRLSFSLQDRRIEIAVGLVGSYVSLIQLRASALQASVSAMSHLAQQRILAAQDQINLDVGYDENEAKWVLNLIPYENEVIASYRGATTVRKGPDKGERLLSNLAGIASTAIAVGTALKSPELGIATFVAGGLLNVLSNWK